MEPRVRVALCHMQHWPLVLSVKESVLEALLRKSRQQLGLFQAR